MWLQSEPIDSATSGKQQLAQPTALKTGMACHQNILFFPKVHN